MKICLISPKVNFSTNCKELHKFWYQIQENEPDKNIWSGVSTALLTIAALTPKEHEVHFIDENVEDIDFSENYDLIGISSTSLNYKHNASNFHRNFPRVG